MSCRTGRRLSPPANWVSTDDDALASGAGLGGAGRDRTDDILLAKQALSQLSYGPSPPLPGRPPARADPPDRRNMVGLGGLEPPTSRLSSARSNQLSYKPVQSTPAFPAAASRTTQMVEAAKA
jgi:hypothetical protein